MAKVMLVEDDNNLREIYEARMAAEGYEIISAPDGEAALALAIKEKPDLIISDIMMPKVSGFDMLDILRSTSETKNAKIIMMTALNQAEDKARAEKLGADMYLVKSQVTLEDVVKAAQKMLGDQQPANVGGVQVVQPTAQTASPAPNTTSLTANAPSVPTQAPAQSIPVQMTDPTPTPAPAEPPVAAPAAPDPIPSSATTAQEEAALQAQIEQFITQNPTISTNADGGQTPAPAVESTASTQTTNTVPAKEPQSSTETISLPEDLPAGEQKIAKNASADSNNTEPGIDASISGRKKVIQPISDISAKGPDLNALLAKEGAVSQANTPSANSVVTPQGVTMPGNVQDIIPPNQAQSTAQQTESATPQVQQPTS